MRQDFTYGVDLGWVSQLEKQGITWTDKSGKHVDPLQALKSMGATAVRLRVFVNPPENAMWRKPKKQAYGREFGGEECMLGLCDGKNVLEMAKRVKKLDMDLMIEEGLKNTEAFVALTGNSETNILACLAAKRMGVSKTVAEVENIDYIGMAESLDIGTVINKKMIAASHIYQMMLDADVSNVKCLTFANADVAEFTVPENAKITKNKVKDLGLPKGTTIGGLIRNGEGILVTGDTLIQAGDHVVVFCLSMMIKKIEKYFN